MERTELTVSFINAHIGQEIEWFCFGNSSNLPYSGKCKILGLEHSAQRKRMQPIIEHISGDSDLTNAWVDFDGETITYTDSYRPVYIGKEFEIYTLQWEVPKSGYLFSSNNPMSYSVVVYLKEDAETLQSKIARKTNAEKVRIEETGDIYMRSSEGKYLPVVTIL